MRRRTNFPMLGIGALAIPLVAFGIVPRLGLSPLTVRSAQSLAAKRGLSPAGERPEKGTTIYQWDPDIVDQPPYLIGKVTNPRFVYHGKQFVEVKCASRRLGNLCLDIKPDGLRYWVMR